MFMRHRQSGGPSAPTPSASKSDYTAQLARVPLFLDLSKRELQQLAATAVEREYAPGEMLIQQGQPGAGLFVIVSGQLTVTQQPDGGGDPRLLRTLGPGDVMGEMALLDDLPRSATAAASEPVRALLIPIYGFRTTLREDPDIAIRMLAVLSRRLRSVEAQRV
jgi:CRP/FNR family transcriptional regulator, cyclic AMP receptor protein